jgi:hypothetical protein
MPNLRQDLAFRHSIASQAIGDQAPRLVLQPVEQALEEAFGCSGVPVIPHEDVEHNAVLVDGTPKIMLLAVDPDEHLILSANC